MSAAKKIKMMLVQREMTLTDLAGALNITLSTLSIKMKRDKEAAKKANKRKRR